LCGRANLPSAAGVECAHAPDRDLGGEITPCALQRRTRWLVPILAHVYSPLVSFRVRNPYLSRAVPNPPIFGCGAHVGWKQTRNFRASIEEPYSMSAATLQVRLLQPVASQVQCDAGARKIQRRHGQCTQHEYLTWGLGFLCSGFPRSNGQ
jgi:hypothetical protein